MISDALLDLLGPRLAESLERRGFTALTAIQAAVLDPNLADCDLRITSQTGSGKTVAIGLVLKATIEAHASAVAKPDGPCTLVVAPTRELAKQLHDELSWLYAPFNIRLACVTGGSSYRDERRALGMSPSIVIGTPGRLVDHLQRRAFDAVSVSTIVLDEADRMLDLGFAEDLESIFAAAPNRGRTHLVSATLGPEVMRLANRFQTNPRPVQGSRPGQAHADIEHVVHVVAPHHRVDALVNVLLAQPDERTLVFVRTRVEVTTVAQNLTDAGFRVATLSGDMEQPARDRALLAFRKDKVRVLVATDVAARGIDIQGMTRVVHFDPPTDPDSYTHRSGRTGRAGQKGSSIVLVAPDRLRQLRALLNQAHISAQLQPLPNVESLRRAADERTRNHLVEALLSCSIEPRQQRLAQDLLRENDAASVVAMLIARTKSTEPEPRIIPEVAAPARNVLERRAQERRPTGAARTSTADRKGYFASQRRGVAPLDSERRPTVNGWGTFQVTWGESQGADARRMLAVVCRRGNIRGADVGAIRIGPTSTIVEVRKQVAAEFAVRAKQPDPNEPRIHISAIDPPNQRRHPKQARPTECRA
jgi:ATP-dependent RNA helicase DeaD